MGLREEKKGKMVFITLATWLKFKSKAAAIGLGVSDAAEEAFANFTKGDIIDQAEIKVESKKKRGR